VEDLPSRWTNSASRDSPSSSSKQDERGRAFFQVRLINKPNEPVGKVLSEGEHRCVALAAFLAELSTIDAQSAIVFDDPVSSLDHQHRDKVAQRWPKPGRPGR
jgi:wobble nucleotide-excising tRNase